MFVVGMQTAMLIVAGVQAMMLPPIPLTTRGIDFQAGGKRRKVESDAGGTEAPERLRPSGQQRRPHRHRGEVREPRPYFLPSKPF